jgi:hypothetical protein
VYGTYYDQLTSSHEAISPVLNSPSIHSNFFIADDFGSYSDGLQAMANGGWSTDVGDTGATFIKTFSEPQDLYNLMGVSLWGKSEYDVNVRVALRDTFGRVTNLSNIGFLPKRWKRMDSQITWAAVQPQIVHIQQSLAVGGGTYFLWPDGWNSVWASDMVQINHYPNLFAVEWLHPVFEYQWWEKDVSTGSHSTDIMYDKYITPGTYVGADAIPANGIDLSSEMYGQTVEPFDIHSVSDILFYIDAEPLSEYYLDEVVIFGFEEEQRNKTWVPLLITSLDTSLMGRTNIVEIAGGMGDIINQDRAQSRRGTMVFKTGHKERDNDVRFVDKVRRFHNKVFLRVGGEGWPLYLNDCKQVPEESIYGIRNEMQVDFIEAE